MAALLSLGLVPAVRSLGAWAVTQIAAHAAPRAEAFLADPAGSVSRLGDLLVWEGTGGRRVIASLEGLQDSQARIERVVREIETAQIGTAGALGALTNLSMFSLGVTSLSAGCMIWRMHALHERLGQLGGQMADIQTHLNAREQAHLQRGLSFLERFERTAAKEDLHTALEESNFATHLYRNLVQAETAGPKRLLVLNQCGRYHMLSLTAQANCLVAGGELSQAEQLLRDEQPGLAMLAGVTFEAVLGESPEIYLDPAFQSDQLTLEVMAEVYQRARRIGAIFDEHARSAGDLFEHLRSSLHGAGGWFRLRGRKKKSLLTNFKYLMACLEEVERVESLRLRIVAASEGRGSLDELRQFMAAEHGKAAASVSALPDPVHVVVFD
ncbi:hypothetical protein [Zavarzinella formosa]|uniref:hypothetical protein n=1 Tax=Zavarzinella formosa TaxID=360055 RepID=UPI00031F3D50|nr:hypothetical protein [Zavarzinella formosa]